MVWTYKGRPARLNNCGDHRVRRVHGRIEA